jgi:uncharacterized membrane protein
VEHFALLLEFVAIFGAGMLAGEEFVVRYGIRGPLASLPDEPHIQMRQALIRTLRVLVPSIYVPTLLLSIVTTVALGIYGAFLFRCAAVAALLLWMVVTLAGTAPINAAALQWQISAPPPDWRARVDRWEQLNTVRTGLAVAAFMLLLLGAAA